MITRIGKQKLEEQVAALKEELRLTYIKRSEAAAEGDLKENSAYIFMGERANVLNSQIAELQDDLNTAIIQPIPTQTDCICFGHQVTVMYENEQRLMTITLVGKNDARLFPGWISCESPIGQALLGKSLSDTITINDQAIKIISIDIP